MSDILERPDPPALELTILMPCLDEAETIGGCVRAALDYLKRANIKGEVLVADNGSTDGSQRIAHTRHGIRERNAGALGARRLPHHRGADHAREGRPHAPAASADLE